MYNVATEGTPTIFRMIDAYPSVYTTKDAREIVEIFSYILRLFYDSPHGDNLFGIDLLLHSKCFLQFPCLFDYYISKM